MIWLLFCNVTFDITQYYWKEEQIEFKELGINKDNCLKLFGIRIDKLDVNIIYDHIHSIKSFSSPRKTDCESY